MLLDSLVRLMIYGPVGSFSANSKSRGAAIAAAATIAAATFLAPGNFSSRFHESWHQHLFDPLLRRPRVNRAQAQ